MTQIIPPPDDLPLYHILPDNPLLLMGAGPVPIPYSVAKANSVVINHLGETMDRVIGRVKLMASYSFQTQSQHILGISGPASAAMEMAITSVLWPSRSVLVLKNGIFSGRFAELAHGVGATVTELETEGIAPCLPTQVEQAFSGQSFDVLTIVQGETSCGVFNRHVKEIAAIAKKNNCLVIVDAVCTLTTMPLYMDEWELDIVVTGGQKGLSSIPGVSLIAFSNRAWEVVEKRTHPMAHWVLDPRRAARFWHHQEYHYTAPVPGILAIHEALRMICVETLEKRFARHKISSEALQEGIEGMGLELFVPPQNRLNSVVAIKLPEGIDSHRLRKFMIENYHVEISGAFGLPIVRIGQMGEQCRPEHLFKTLYAMGMALKKQNFSVDIASAMVKLESKLEAWNT